jgi:dihydroorotase-like cyclic amidohydrolase
MPKKLLKNATLVSEGRRQLADVLIDGALISKIDNDISDASR